MRRARFRHRFALALCALLQATMLPVATAESQPQSGRIEDGGVRLDWRYETLPESSGSVLGKLDLTMTDALSESPLRYRSGQIAAWFQASRSALSDREVSCRDKVKLLATQGVGRRAEVDLNTYRIVTLNDDRSVGFINPFVGINNAKLESIVVLPGPARAWLHVPDRMTIWVRTTSPDRLVAIDTHSRRIVRSVDLPTGTFIANADSAIAYSADDASLWMPLPALGAMARLDLRTADAALRIVPAPGVLNAMGIATATGTRIVTTHDDGSVQEWQGAAVDDSTRRRDEPPVARVVRRWSLPGPATQVLWSALSERLIATDGSALVWLEADGRLGRRVALDALAGRVALFDEGRRALVVGDGRMRLIDLATGAIQARSDAVDDVATVLFTDGYAYAISPARGKASLWSLSQLRAGQAQPVEVLLGSADDTRSPAAANAGFDRAALAPTGAGVLFANGADALVYQYAEGMMAPVGSYSNYKRNALAMTLLDLAPREVSPGHYVAVERHERGGKYELVVSGVGPGFAACDTVALSAPASTETPAQDAVTLALAANEALGGGRWRLEVDMHQGATRAPRAGNVDDMPDLTLLIFDKRSGWQRRVPLHAMAPGRYAADVAVPRPGRYELLAHSVALDLSFVQGRIGSVDLGDVVKP